MTDLLISRYSTAIRTIPLIRNNPSATLRYSQEGRVNCLDYQAVTWSQLPTEEVEEYSLLHSCLKARSLDLPSDQAPQRSRH